VFAVIEAVKAKHAFTYPDVARWLASAFACSLAQFAVDTFTFVFADSPNRKPVYNSQKRTERADKPAVKSRYNKIEQNSRQEYREY
jgi:hypothetical protein